MRSLIFVCCILLCVMYIEYFTSGDTTISYKNIQIYYIYIKIVKPLKHEMFRPLLCHYQVYCFLNLNVLPRRSCCPT
jgi:hypothetical protein